ncbi:plantacyanin [Perilla frutescens var. hirtella]|nr:plantacyanin [Perilla frutescens var. hirtella]
MNAPDEMAEAATYTVGGSGGWTFNVVGWPKGKTFKAGDTLVFNYNSAIHNVMAVDKGGYKGCVTTTSGAKVFQTEHLFGSLQFDSRELHTLVERRVNFGKRPAFSTTPYISYTPNINGLDYEKSPVPSASPLHVNGRFRNIDDTDDHNGNSTGAGIEYDSVSNNGSWSGESEDPKEKSSQSLPHQDTIPGADNDKREKIR